MAIITYENVTPAYENTTMQKFFVDGVHRQYVIQAVEGYVLHDNELDFAEVDENYEIIGTLQGYTTGTVSCAASYDFEENPREFFAALRSTVPENHIFGGGDNHEVM